MIDGQIRLYKANGKHIMAISATIISYTLLFKILKDAKKVKTVIAVLSAVVSISVILLSILVYLAN